MKLIECGADVNKADLLGHTAVFYACNSSELRNVILLLVHHGAALALCDLEGNTIMHQVSAALVNR
jgi:ankyrin repeat protein